MKNKALAAMLVVVAFLMVGSAFAHHSNAVVDKDKLLTMPGTVTKFLFINPHVAVYYDVKDASGKSVNWYAAGAGPLALHKDAGWTNKTFTDGEQILVQGHPLRDGRPIMAFRALYACSTGEAIPLDKGNDSEYRTRVKLVHLDPAAVKAACNGSKPIAPVLGIEETAAK